MKAARWSPEELAEVLQKSSATVAVFHGSQNQAVSVVHKTRARSRSKKESAKAIRDYLIQLQAADIETPELEYKFFPGRGWRADFAWPKRKLLVEFEGAIYTQGRHTRGKGFEDDCEKYNMAAILGFRVIRITTNLIKDGRAFEFTKAAYFAPVPFE